MIWYCLFYIIFFSIKILNISTLSPIFYLSHYSFLIWMLGKFINYQSRLFSSSLRDISIKGFFSAKNYAIVGASTKPGTMGNIICENYKKRFKGEVFYINPKGKCFFCSINNRRWIIWKANLQNTCWSSQKHWSCCYCDLC